MKEWKQVLAADDHWSTITAHGVKADATQVVSQLPIFRNLAVVCPIPAARFCTWRNDVTN